MNSKLGRWTLAVLAHLVLLAFVARHDNQLFRYAAIARQNARNQRLPQRPGATGHQHTLAFHQSPERRLRAGEPQ